jgi:hypothetical protein
MFSKYFRKKADISGFVKIRPVRAELFHTDEQTEGQTEVTKLKVDFRNFADAPKKSLYFLMMEN